ncbi:MAG: hypothetical protein AAF399_12075 [Bacteroidota bacterium]
MHHPLRIWLLIWMIGACSASSFAQSSPALTYLESVMSPLGEHKQETWKYLRAVTRGKGARKVEKKRQALIQAIRDSKRTVARQGGFQGDLSLKKSVSTYLDISYSVLKEDYDKILDMEAIAEQSYDAMEAYLLTKEQANKKLDEAWATMDEQYRTFAAAYNIEIVEGEADDQDKKIQESQALLSYYNRLYLIFFKSYIQEVYVMAAMEEDDLNSLEQNIGALLAFSAEGTAKLDTISLYQDDPALKQATQKILSYFQEAGERHYPQVVDFYLKKDNFEQLKTVVDTKPQKELTQEDVDRFNAAVEDYNASVNQVNSVNETLNQRRGKEMEAFNKAMDKFLTKHSL